MRGVDWRAASIAALCGCACGPLAAASDGRRPNAPAAPAATTATEWIGARASDAAAGAAPAAAGGAAPAWVLHVGDSFTEAWLYQNLAPRFRAGGARYVVDARTSTSTTTWAYDARFDELLSRRPALVVVTLGANEAVIPHPDAHAGAVERIARKIQASGAACVWLSPPMWTADTGIVQVIHDHCAPCLFFDSDAVLGGLARAERQPDGIHPNRRGGARWAAAFWGWLADHRDPGRGPWALEPFERRGP